MNGNSKVWAVLIDTVSIQKYVFGSNKLKENLGASDLIHRVYEEPLQEVVKRVVSESQYGAVFEIGYIGGGNALLFFRDKDMAQRFVREWTRDLLVKCPGIATAVAIDQIDISDHAFYNDKKGLFKQLRDNKARYFPQTILPRHGITAECPRTGYSMDVWSGELLPKDERNYISSVSYAKLMAAREAKKDIERYIPERFKKGSSSGALVTHTFTDELDKLGQLKGEESYIAIVHIDGNGMGKRFMNTKTLSEIRNLSKTVQEATENSFRAMLERVLTNFEKIQECLGYKDPEAKRKYPKEDGKHIIPLRPIIIGGDDITFVTDGRLGVYLAKIFIEEFEKQNVSDGIPLSACAGVAITKTKYPFYRGYRLSEDLCKNAKDIRKSHNDNGSWIDFHIAYGGFSGSIEDIRKSHYKTPDGAELCFRPYKVGSSEEQGLDLFIENARRLKENFPNSKLKELREVATAGKARAELYMKGLEARRLKLPEINGTNYHKEFFENNKTPYFDMIEIMEFYPFELDDGGEI